jgi:hypothetical protein
VRDWHISVLATNQSAVNKTLVNFKLAQAVQIGDILSLATLAFRDELYCKIRDSSCRFIDFGLDYVFYLCLKLDDKIEPEKWHARSLMVEDISIELIESDRFDI